MRVPRKFFCLCLALGFGVGQAARSQEKSKLELPPVVQSWLERVLKRNEAAAPPENPCVNQALDECDARPPPRISAWDYLAFLCAIYILGQLHSLLTSRRRKSQDKKFEEGYSTEEATEAVAQGAPSEESLVAAAAPETPRATVEALRIGAYKFFLLFQEVSRRQSFDVLRPLLSPALFKLCTEQMAHFQKLDRVPSLEKVEVRSIEIIEPVKWAHQFVESFTVRIEGRADRMVRNGRGSLISHQVGDILEYWTFERTSQGWQLRQITSPAGHASARPAAG